jgi:hypothetical protein
LFSSLVNKVEHAGNSLLICMVQLKEGTFFAKNQIGQFPALLARYFREQGSKDKGFFLIDFVRGKGCNDVEGRKIPTQYFEDTEEIKRIDEIETIKQDESEQSINSGSEESND